jgi:hypothetical protein
MSLFNFAASLKRILPARSTRGQRRSSPHRASLRLEYLEDRMVPAVMDVTPGHLGTFATIQEAVNAASPGDTIVADAGTYAEHVTINKSLTLEGAQHGVDARTRSGAESIVDGGGFAPFYVTADDVTIDGFTIQGASSGSAFPGGYGIEMAAGISGAHITNNIIQNNIAGIALANQSASDPAVIQHNLFQNNTLSGAATGTDIYADQFTAGAGGVNGVLIDSNTFTNSSFTENAWALGMSNTGTTPFSNITFSNNDVTNHGRGAYFYATTDSTVTGNTIAGASHYAIGLFGYNGAPANSSFTISNNTLDADGSGGAGVMLANDTSASAYSGILTVVDAGANVSPTEGSAFTGGVATFTDPTGTQTAGDYSASITWGDLDGSGNPLTSQGTIVDLGGGKFQVVGSHIYAEEGNYHLSVSITAADSSTTRTSGALATVADAALSAGQLTPPRATAGVSTGNVVLFHFTDANPNATVADYTAVVNWGDGSSDSSAAANPAVRLVANPNGGFDVVGSHTYAAAASGLTLSVTVRDVGGAAPLSASTTLGVAGAAQTPSTPPTSNPPSNTQFLGKVYLDLLGRGIDPAGLSWWTGRFNEGATRQQIVGEIENSAEYHRVEVSKLYAQLLHRPADEAGMSFHTGVLQSGGTLEEVAALIAGSQEYFMNRGGGTNAGFLRALYQDGLNRALDARGNAVFTAALQKGATPGEVAAVIFGSSEFALNQVESYYQQFLHRSADSAGLEFFTDVLSQGGHDEDAIALMLASDEYFNRT